MDETNDETAPAVEETAQACCREEAEAENEGGKCRCGCLGGLLSGAVVGGVLAWLLAPKVKDESGRSESGAEEGHPPAQVALERAEAVAWGAASWVVGAWKTIRERLRDAVEEGKEGMTEGQAEARARYEFMTKRRRPRR